jgi:hypothetical protein
MENENIEAKLSTLLADEDKISNFEEGLLDPYISVNEGSTSDTTITSDSIDEQEHTKRSMSMKGFEEESEPSE